MATKRQAPSLLRHVTGLTERLNYQPHVLMKRRSFCARSTTNPSNNRKNIDDEKKLLYTHLTLPNPSKRRKNIDEEKKGIVQPPDAPQTIEKL
jgi:hypothetical protein